jgi:hypothetical protein
MYTKSNEIYFNQQTHLLDHMTDTEVQYLQVSIGEALDRTTAQIEYRKDFEETDRDWLRRARTAVRYMAEDLRKIEARLSPEGPQEPEPEVAKPGLQFKIVGIREEKVAQSDALVQEVVNGLRDLQQGQKALLLESEERASQIKKVMPKVVEILGWKEQRPGKRLCYRASRKVHGDEVLLTIYRFGDDDG